MGVLCHRQTHTHRLTLRPPNPRRLYLNPSLNHAPTSCLAVSSHARRQFRTSSVVSGNGSIGSATSISATLATPLFTSYASATAATLPQGLQSSQIPVPAPSSAVAASAAATTSGTTSATCQSTVTPATISSSTAPAIAVHPQDLLYRRLQGQTMADRGQSRSKSASLAATTAATVQQQATPSATPPITLATPTVDSLRPVSYIIKVA